MAAVGIGAVGVVVVATGWARTLTLYPLLVSMVLFFLSLALSPRAILAIGLEFWGWVLVLDCGWVGHDWVCCSWVWDQAYPLIPNTFSSFR